MKVKARLIAAMLVCGLAGTTGAAERAVGLAPPITVGSGCTYATIGEALTATSPGSVILLEGGVAFSETVSITADVSLRGGYSGCNSGSSAPTTVDAGGNGRVFSISGTVDVTLANLVISGAHVPMSDGGGIAFSSGTLTIENTSIVNCVARRGGGLWLGPGATLTATGVDIRLNSATIAGGGLRLYGATAEFSGDNEITDNEAPLGGGVAGVAHETFSPQLTISLMTDIASNEALTGDGLGGGIFMRDGSIRIDAGVFVSGNSAENGGGIYLERSTLDARGPMVGISYNSANTNGGGIHAVESEVSVSGGIGITNNRALGLVADGAGGGMYLDASDLHAQMALFMDNAAMAGGAVYAAGSSSITFSGAPDQPPASSGVMVSFNTSVGGGAGICIAEGSTADLRRTTIAANEAGHLGGALWVSGSSLTMSDSLIAENSSGIGPGVAVWVADGSTMVGRGLTLAYNAADGAATGVAIGVSEELSPSHLDLENSIVWGHIQSIGGEADVQCSCIQGGWVGDGNLDQDPVFVDASSSDYELAITSPVIDRCASSSGSGEDAWGNLRPWVVVRPDTPFDMGAFEAESIPRAIFFSSFEDGTLDEWSGSTAHP